jgi:Icc-related predicted phosphoesterase
MERKSNLKIVAISDTHGKHATMKHVVPSGDVLVHAGDFTRGGRRSEVEQFAHWLGRFPHKHKLVIPGNHDAFPEFAPAEAVRIFEAYGAKLLLHETVEIEGFKFFGSPYTPAFLNWHFMLQRGAELRDHWHAIAPGTDVVVTHGPAYGHGDLVPSYKGETRRVVGCLELLKRLQDVRPRYHIFGHIHDGYGVSESDEVPGTVFANVAICTETYRPLNAPFVFDLTHEV